MYNVPGANITASPEAMGVSLRESLTGIYGERARRTLGGLRPRGKRVTTLFVTLLKSCHVSG